MYSISNMNLDKNEMYVKNILKTFNNGNEYEFEVRFGEFVYNRETKKSNFTSEVETLFFYNLKRSLEQQNFKKTKINTTEYSWGENKKIINNDTDDVTYMIKKRLSNRDVYDYDIRFSLSSEITIDKLEEKGEPNFVRNKERITYEIPIGKVDLTIVNGDELKYEVELECKKGINYADLIEFVEIILKIRQQNYMIISNYEKRNVINKYKTLLNLNGNFFIGAQPETLQKQTISDLYKNEYSVTDKADGDRMLLLIDDNRRIYYIDNNIKQVFKTDIKSKNYSNCILDGELVKVDNVILFYAFDVLMYGGKDIRGDTKYLLKTRLNRLNDIVNSIESNEEYIVRMKKFYYNNVFLGAETLLSESEIKNKPYENDGLIFTPMNQPYPNTKKWKDLLKWKPSELNTIDLYAVKGDLDEWNLYVQHKEYVQGKLSDKSELMLFDVNKLCPETEPIKELTFRTQIDPTEIDPSTNESYKTNTVIEFKWDKKRARFVPLRTRWDKTANKNKHGNFSSVACNIWYNIQNPISKELLFKFTTARSSKNGSDVYFNKMRRLHNKIKEYLYNKYITNTEYLLELCSGKGGDMHKWVHNKVKNVHGFDIDNKSVVECRRRVESIGLSESQFKFFELDLTKVDSWKEIIKRTNIQKYDNISCQFAIHYFFQSEQTFNTLIDILDNVLKNGGYFIVTFMDDNELYKLTGEESITSKLYNEEIVYYIEKGENKVKEKFGNNLRIVLSGNNVLTTGSNEWVIPYNKFVKTMEKRGYNLVETKLFKEFRTPNLSEELLEYEKDISGLNRFCVFKKGNAQGTSITDNVVLNTKIISEKSSMSFSNIELNKDFSVHKVNDYYDIIDVLNSISYKFNKYNIDNKELHNFSDIEELFKSFKEYIPIYIDTYNTTDTTLNKIYFTYYKHIVESVELGEIEHDNWYIVLYKNKLLYKLDKNIFNKIEKEKVSEKEEVTENISEKEEVTENTSENQDTYNKEKSKIKKDIKKKLKDEKHTVKLYKEILESIGLKTSGKKEELIDRIKTYLRE